MLRRGAQILLGAEGGEGEEVGVTVKEERTEEEVIWEGVGVIEVAGAEDEVMENPLKREQGAAKRDQCQGNLDGGTLTVRLQEKWRSKLMGNEKKMTKMKEVSTTGSWHLAPLSFQASPGLSRTSSC